MTYNLSLKTAVNDIEVAILIPVSNTAARIATISGNIF
jgi:hypothetical protein